VKSKLAEVTAEVDDFASWSEDLTFTWRVQIQRENGQDG
jgi:hypothetical protein